MHLIDMYCKSAVFCSLLSLSFRGTQPDMYLDLRTAGDEPCRPVQQKTVNCRCHTSTHPKMIKVSLIGLMNVQ